MPISLKILESSPITIIRYRDDYRIFTNNEKEGNTVIGELSKILSEMGMRLNGEKTYHSDDIVNSSISSPITVLPSFSLLVKIR
jgi:hypothetical protein